jgi:ribonuclease VapC
VIVDASADLAIMLHEEDAKPFSDAMALAPDPWMSAVNFVEAAIRMQRLRPAEARSMLDALIGDSRISIRSVSVIQAELAREAHLTYGKGRHPARLNLGDCFAYALARESGRPLLYKGGDFARTDIEPALPPA